MQAGGGGAEPGHRPQAVPDRGDTRGRQSQGSRDRVPPVNPATTFDLDRAHKWLQGRARPRDAARDEDWAALLEIGKTGFWVANCPLAEFAAALAARGPLAADTLQERADAFRGGAVLEPGQAPELTGSYVCYSHAWSPYFRGRIIRGELTIAISGATRRLVALLQRTPADRADPHRGSVTLADRAIHLDLRAPGGVHLVFCLFPASAPASLLGGLMCGATVIGPDSQPSVTRIVMVRLPPRVGTSPEADPYLPAGSLYHGRPRPARAAAGRARAGRGGTCRVPARRRRRRTRPDPGPIVQTPGRAVRPPVVRSRRGPGLRPLPAHLHHAAPKCYGAACPQTASPGDALGTRVDGVRRRDRRRRPGRAGGGDPAEAARGREGAEVRSAWWRRARRSARTSSPAR